MYSSAVRYSRQGVFGVLFLSSLALMGSCAEVTQVVKEAESLQGGGQSGAATPAAVKPDVTASPLKLQRYPNLRLLAAHFCPVALKNPLERMACSAALGAPPPPDQLTFEFGTTITVKNPNNIPIPALEVLLGLKLFSGQATESVGAVCMSMCGSQDATCTGAPKPDGCTAGGPGIRNLNDFVAAVPGLIAGLASGAVQSELRKSQIAAGGDVSLNLNFALGVDQALRVLEKVVDQFLKAQLEGRGGALEIPVSGEGTVFVQLPALGKVGVGFGPLQTSWRLL
jgi:hypothetical protein